MITDFLKYSPFKRIVLTAAMWTLATGSSAAWAEEVPEAQPVEASSFVTPDAAPTALPVSLDTVQESLPTDDKATSAEKDKPVVLGDAKDEEIKGTHLSLEECIEIAILNNLGLRISRLNDRATDLTVNSAWAQYYPEFAVGINHNNTESSGTKVGPGSTSIDTSMTQKTPWGTTLEFDVSEARSRSDTATATTDLRASVTQPLWKGAGTDVGLAQIRAARINRLISRGALDVDVQTLIFNIRSAYADVIRNLQSREVNRQAVRSDKAFLTLTVALEKAGRDTKLDVFNAEVSLKGRELNLIANETQLESAYDRLKQLMDIDFDEVLRVDEEVIDFGEKSEADISKELVSDDAAGTVQLMAYSKDRKVVGESKMLFQAQRFEDKAVLEEALHNRIDLLNSRRSLAIQKIQTMLSKDGLGQQLDLVGSFNHAGAGHSVLEADNGREVNGWTVGLNAKFPWGKIHDRAAYETALLDLQKSEINLKRAQVQVQAEIRDILRVLRENEKALLIEGVRVENAKRSVAAQQSLYDRGLNNSFNVIRAGDDLLRAKTNFVSSKLSYVVALSQLKLRVGKPTGRVELGGRDLGGLIDAKLPQGLKERGLPRSQPEVESRPENDPRSSLREYRKDSNPKAAPKGKDSKRSEHSDRAKKSDKVEPLVVEEIEDSLTKDLKK